MNTLKRISSMLLVTFLFVLITQARADTSSGHFVYLPMIVKPPFIVADFDNCTKTNNLGGEMGAAYEPATNDRLTETYVPEGQGCVVSLAYIIPDSWSAFWLKLLKADLTSFKRLSFDVQFSGEPDPATDMAVKVELKRGCHVSECDEVWIQYVPGITEDEQRVAIELSDFKSLSDESPPPPLVDIEELVFTFEKGYISNEGTVFLDNIIFDP